MQRSYTYVSSFFLAIFYSMALLGAPIITNVNPNFGPTSGGNTVTITGSGFTGATAVDFGTIPTAFTVNSDTVITAIAPIGAVGDIQIIVNAPSGSSSLVPASYYVYQGSWFALVTDISDNTLIPVNLSSNTVGASIPVGTNPVFNPVITPNGSRAYVPNAASNSISVIDLSTNSVIATISGVPIPNGMAMLPNGSFAYATNGGIGTNTIQKIDVATNTIVATIPTGELAGDAKDIAITPNGLFAYVTSANSNNVDVIDLTSDSSVAFIPIAGSFPFEIAITPNGQTAYVTINGGSTVIPINLATNTPEAPISVGMAPFGLAITPDGSKVYVANAVSKTVSVISTATNSVIATIPVELTPENIAIAPDGLRAYVTQISASLSASPGSLGAPVSGIVVIDTTINAVLTTIPLGVLPTAIAITPDQAPVAEFSFASPNVFDASRSVTSVGSIASYAWNFGDGTTLVTTSPIVTHSYASTGAFVVTLTVTNTAGTSTTQTFTGHVVSNNGGPSAVLTELVLVPGAPPSHFTAHVIKNKFATQTDIIHKLRWRPSTDPTVVEYRIFRNGKLIAVIPAGKPSVYLDHNRRKHERDIYTLIAVNSSGIESAPLTAIIP